MIKLATFTKFFLAALLISALPPACGLALAEDQPPSEVVAEVGGHKITLGQLEQHSNDNMNRARSQLVQAHIGMYQAERAALDHEIDKEILSEAAKNEGKSPEIVEKMIAGRLRKSLNEITLLGQPFIKDQDQTVEKLLKGGNARVVRFERFEVGAGIEKKKEDFRAAVMAEVNKSPSAPPKKPVKH